MFSLRLLRPNFVALSPSQASIQRDSAAPVEMAILDTPSELWKAAHHIHPLGYK